MTLAPSLRLALGLGLAILAAPTSASAFSNHLTFGRDPIEPDPMDPMMQSGGGGGRYFTGSVLDGYTCEVCHRGGPPLNNFAVNGWPEDGYTPGGGDVAIEVRLPEARISAASIEVVTETGSGAGELVLEPNPQADDSCPAVPPEMAYNAANVVEIPQSRTVAVMDACAGVRRLRVRWTPPAMNVGAVWLNVASVGSDGSGDPEGDTVYTHAFLTPPVGETVVPGRVMGGCHVSRDRTSPLPSACAAIAAIALLVRARRRRG
ncbi:MAG: hypothetical protein AB7S26_40985 [Sandaracinaceae bacterium]